MKQYAVIVAGGSGTRMGGGIPKQFRSLCGRPLLWWSMKAFHDENPQTEIILVLPADFIDLWNDFFSSLPKEAHIPHKITVGGNTRSESVCNGLKYVEEDDSLVAIHDGARPLVGVGMISEGWEAAKISGAAIPVVSVTDSLRKISDDDSIAVNRSEYVAVQTPQMFHTDKLKKAYAFANGASFTDDASVMENAGFKISLYKGDFSNMKVTNPNDLVIATILMDKNA